MRTILPLLLPLTLLLLAPEAWTSDGCCETKIVTGRPEKAGTYRLSHDRNTLERPGSCINDCVYTKDNDPKDSLYCFKRSSDYSAECEERSGSPEQFDNFMNKFNKTYANESEKARRYEIWSNNIAFITEHNKLFDANKTTFRLGENLFADWTTKEFSEKLNGYKERTGYRGQMKPEKVAARNLPSSVDWRTMGYVTPVKNQGQCGSCWAFSATGAMEGAHFKATGNLVSLSEQNLVECDTVSHGCSGGWMTNAFQYVINNNGIDTEACYPYTSSTTPITASGYAGTCKFDSSCIGATINSYTDVTSGSEAALQQAVADIGPVSVAIVAGNPSFHHYHSGIYKEPACSSQNLDHGVLAVGYGSETAGDFWIVKNSWGTGWGMDGYIKMSRNNNNNCGIATAASYPVSGCCTTINVSANGLNGMPNGFYRKRSSLHNGKPVYESDAIVAGGWSQSGIPGASGRWCIFLGGHWKIDWCNFLVPNYPGGGDWSQGMVWSGLDADCPGNIGGNWHYYSWSSAGSNSGPVDPTIQVSCESPGPSPMDIVYSKAEEHQLVQGTLLTTLPTLGKEWRVTHDLKPTGYLNDWANSLHLTIGENNGRPGDRTPAIWPSGFGRLRIDSGPEGGDFYEKYFDQPPVNVWTTITISQTLEGGKMMYRISIEGEEVLALENTQPEEFQGVKVYGSDPWHEAQPGSIRNLVIETRLPRQGSPDRYPILSGWRTIFDKLGEHTLRKGFLLATLAELGKEWKVTHDFKPTRYISNFTNSIHLSTGENNSVYGWRTLAIFPSGPRNKMLIFSDINGNTDKNPVPQPPTNEWTRITISQTLENGQYLFKISIDSEPVIQIENNDPKDFKDVKVYASNPWAIAQPGSIKNLVIETKLD